MPQRIILYELNEVPWQIVDLYIASRPHSTLAKALPRSLALTTICADPAPLQPWRTWPDLHTSMYTPDHNSYDLGQDPTTFRGDQIWNVADRAGRIVGIFGPMQSWPPKQFTSGGFYVPDTFARTSSTIPRSLERFQQFNLDMTRENTFSPERAVSFPSLAGVGVDLFRQGLTWRSAAMLSRHLLNEMRDHRHQASRSTMQALPSFDLFWRLHRKHSPNLSIFFTNHVAGMMHRYWGDGVPGYTSAAAYLADPVYAGFVTNAMDIFDLHLATILNWAENQPDITVVVASSMGQGAIDKENVDETFVLDDPLRLGRLLGFDAEVGSAMYPRTSYMLEDAQGAVAATEAVSSIQSSGTPLFEDARIVGRSFSFAIDQGAWERTQNRTVTYTRVDATDARGDVADLGVTIRRRMGGGNTAYHTPEGIFLVWGTRITPDSSRGPVSLLDAAPSILQALNVAIPASYQGSTSINLSGASNDRQTRFDT